MSEVFVGERHTATATVGLDKVEAEYFEFEHTDLGIDLNLWDKITLPFYKVRYKVKDAYWKARYGFQRMFKGYDNVDTFDIFSKFVERYKKIIKEFRDNHYGYPGTITNEEWDNILDTMLYHLHYMEEDNVIKELEKDVPENWSVSLKTVNDVMEKHKNGFFTLFSEYFFSLWD